jgi:hypothetical protein
MRMKFDYTTTNDDLRTQMEQVSDEFSEMTPGFALLVQHVAGTIDLPGGPASEEDLKMLLLSGMAGKRH